MFPSFEFSNIKDKQAWYVDTLHFQKDREEVLKKLEGLEGKDRKQAATEETMKLMKENWFDRRKNLEKEQ